MNCGGNRMGGGGGPGG